MNYLKVSLIIFTFIMITTLTCNADEWAISFDNGSVEHYPYVLQTLDNGYLVSSYTHYDDYGGHYDAWLIKLDDNGSIIWEKSYGDSQAEFFNEIGQTNDGGYIAAGYTQTFGQDTWILKLNPDGTVDWQNRYDWDYGHEIVSITQTQDGGYIGAGWFRHTTSGVSQDFWVVKLKSNGTIDWQKTYGGENEDRAYSIEQTAEGGYVILGYTESFGAGNGDIWVLKLFPSGAVEWQKTYGGSGQDWSRFSSPFSIQQTLNGGYIVLGATGSFGPEGIWILKLRADGSVEFQKKVVGGLYGSLAFSIAQTFDDGYIVAGATALTYGVHDGWILKFLLDGTLEWQKTFGDSGGSSEDHAYFIQQTTDHGYIAAGYIGSGENPLDILILKLDENGEIPGCNIFSAINATVTDTEAEVHDTFVAPQETFAVESDINIVPQDTTAQTSVICYNQTVITVDIDIKPGSETNCINNNGHGVIPAAILGSADFDSAQVDPETISLEGLSIKMVGKSNKYLAHYEDVNNDGFDDLVLQIEDTDTVYQEGQTEAKLSGNLYEEYGGTEIEGIDNICIVPSD